MPTDIFPTASSTPSAEHLVERVLCHYDLPGGVVGTLDRAGLSVASVVIRKDRERIGSIPAPEGERMRSMVEELNLDR